MSPSMRRSQSLHKLDTTGMDTTKRRFDIAYLIAKENLAFTKMAPLCELQEMVST